MDIVEFAEVIMELLNCFSSVLLLVSNKGVEAENAPPIDLSLFSEKLVKQEAELNYVFGGDFEETGSPAEDVEETPSPLELVSVHDIESMWR